jgi:hypothetical protein
MGFHYSYSDGDGYPLLKCPECGIDLTQDCGIHLELTVAGNTIATAIRLRPDGSLVDTPDGAVRQGNHSGTYCGHCLAPLIDFESQEWD